MKYETDIQHSMANILQQIATTNHPQRERWFPTEADVGGVLLSWWWCAVLLYSNIMKAHLTLLIALCNIKGELLSNIIKPPAHYARHRSPPPLLPQHSKRRKNPAAQMPRSATTIIRPLTSEAYDMLWILFKVKLDPLAKYNELEVRRLKVNNNCLSFFLFRYGLVRFPNPFF